MSTVQLPMIITVVSCGRSSRRVARVEPATGLSPDAVVVFDAIAGRGDHDAAELPARVGLARQRVHDAMSELVRGGLASVVRGQSGALRVRVDSSRAVRSLVRSGGGTGAAEVLRSRSTLAAVVDGAEDASIGVERITDLADVQARLEEFATSIRREVLVLAAGEMPSEEQLREARETDLGVLRRGIAMLMVYPYDVCRTA